MAVLAPRTAAIDASVFSFRVFSCDSRILYSFAALAALIPVVDSDTNFAASRALETCEYARNGSVATDNPISPMASMTRA